MPRHPTEAHCFVIAAEGNAEMLLVLTRLASADLGFLFTSLVMKVSIRAYLSSFACNRRAEAKLLYFSGRALIILIYINLLSL